MAYSIQDVYYIFISLFAGLIIGAEREYRSKPAGLRTMMLVSVGSCIFTILSIKIGASNPDRIAANILTGIGFLGAGAIFKDDNKVSGLTTATTIWICSAIGMCIGSGYVVLGIVSTFVVMVTLSLLTFLQAFIDNYNQTRDYKILCSFNQETLKHYEQIFEENGLKYIRGLQSRNEENIVGHWKLSGSKKNHDKLLTYLLNIPEIKELDF